MCCRFIDVPQRNIASHFAFAIFLGVCLISPPVFAEIVLGEEVLLDDSDLPGTPMFGNIQTAVNGDTILLVWEEWTRPLYRHRLYAARMDADTKEVLDPDGISLQLGRLAGLAVTPAGGGFVVGWTAAVETDDGMYHQATYQTVSAADGALGEKTIISEVADSSNGFISKNIFDDIACMEDRCLIVENCPVPVDDDSQEVPYCLLDLSTGQLGDTMRIPEREDGLRFNLHVPALAFKSGFIVTGAYDSVDSSEIEGFFVDADSGAITGTFSFPISRPIAHSIRTATNGTDLLVTWFGNNSEEVYAVRIAGEDLSVIDTQPISIGDAIWTMPGDEWEMWLRRLEVTSNGQDYLLSMVLHGAPLRWTSADVYMVGIDAATGAVSVPSESARLVPIPPSNNEDNSHYYIYVESVDVCWTGSDYLATWSSTMRLDGAVFTAADGPVTRISDIVTSTYGRDYPPFKREPAAASNGDEYLVAWSDGRNNGTTGRDIYATRLDGETGLPVGEAIAICTAPGDQTYPSVAYNGTDYLVAWQDFRNAQESGTDIYAARISGADGTLLDPDGIVITAANDDQLTPKAAASGENFLVLGLDWRDRENRLTDIVGARVTPDGVNLDPDGVVIWSSRELESNLDVTAADDGTVMAIWKASPLLDEGAESKHIMTRIGIDDTLSLEEATTSLDVTDMGIINGPYHLIALGADDARYWPKDAVPGTPAETIPVGMQYSYLHTFLIRKGAGAGSDIVVAWSDYESGRMIGLAHLKDSAEGGSLEEATAGAGGGEGIDINRFYGQTQSNLSLTSNGKTFLLAYETTTGGDLLSEEDETVNVGARIIQIAEEPVDTDGESNFDTDTGGDTNTDTAADSDTDSGADADTDSDSDSDEDTDTDTDTNSDVDTDADTDSDADAESSTDTDTDTASNANMDTENDSIIPPSGETATPLDSGPGDACGCRAVGSSETRRTPLSTLLESLL